MTDHDKEKKDEVPDPELLPPRDVMSLINPTSLPGTGGLLGATPDGGGAAPGAGAAPMPDATHTATDAQHLASSHVPQPDGQPAASDHPQAIPVDSTKSASSKT